MSKKICYITTLATTLESFVFPVAQYISDNTDWDIYMICSEDSLFSDKLPSGIKYLPVSMKRGISIGGIRAMLEMVRIFKREKFDLIQYSTPNAALYASMAGWLAHIPIRLYCQWGLAYVGMQGLKRKIFRMEEKFVCKLSTWIEPDSNSNLQFAHDEKLYPEEKGSVIGYGSACGVNLNKFDIEKKNLYRKEVRGKYKISEDSYVYIFVGRITKDKGIDELLAAFKEVYSNDKRVYLLMVGRLEAIESLNQDLYSWSCDCTNVIYTGATNVVEQYLAASDCYILPSYREGFGMGIIEAEAMGVPVIVTNIPGPVDAMISDITGMVVEKKNINELIDAMITMRQNRCSTYGIRGYEFVKERFSQEKLCELILEDRKRLLNS